MASKCSPAPRTLGTRGPPIEQPRIGLCKAEEEGLHGGDGGASADLNLGEGRVESQESNNAITNPEAGRELTTGDEEPEKAWREVHDRQVSGVAVAFVVCRRLARA